MTTPTTLRDLAACVVAGVATNEDVALAFGWKPAWTPGMWARPGDPEGWIHTVPALLTSRDAAAGLMPEGWRVIVSDLGAAGWEAEATNPEGTRHGHVVTAPTEPQARTALALLVRAAMMEGEQT